MTEESNLRAAVAREGPVHLWREFYDEAVQQFAAASVNGAAIQSPESDARWIVAEAGGFERAELALMFTVPATTRGVAEFDSMVARRLKGEPLQYVLGRWAFRSLDLMVDRRVLIPRPETEVVAGVAIEELQRLAPRRDGRLAIDLGTGSGAIGLSIAAECDGVDVVLTDASADALAVARGNLAGLGTRGTAVRLYQGDWFAAVPEVLAGHIDVVVSNPPYISVGESLPVEVGDWEPSSALFSGFEGLDAAARLIDEASHWLTDRGVLVLELAPQQMEAASALTSAAGFSDVAVLPDMAGRERVLRARR